MQKGVVLKWAASFCILARMRGQEIGSEGEGKDEDEGEGEG